MDAKTIVHDLDALHVDFYCTACNGLMYWTYSIGHDKVLHCGRCGHEVMWGVRFEACRVDEFRPEVAYATAPLGGAK